MGHGSRTFAAKAAFAASVCFFASSALGSSIGIYTRGTPTPAFATLVGAPARLALTAAVAEMAFGDVTKAARNARLAGLPERLSVYIEAPGLPTGRSSGLVAWTQASIREWFDAIPEVGLEFVISPARANVLVRFEDRLTVDGRRVAGVIDWRRSVRTRQSSAELELRALIRVSNRYSTGSLMTEGQIKKTVAHEFGHLLGLDDEDCSKALMGPVGRYAKGVVTEREKEAVAELNAMSEEIAAAATATRRRSREPSIFKFVK